MTGTEQTLAQEPSQKRHTISVVIGVIAVALLVLAGVLLLISRPVEVPDIRTQTVSEATTALESAGLILGATSEVATQAVGAGRVLEQAPAPGSKVVPRRSVDVTIGVAPVDAQVIDVTGQDVASATQALADALFTPVSVEVFGVDDELGSVIEQAPSAGTDWVTGLPVAIAVAAGPDDGSAVEVPDLEGLTIEAALARLAEVGLVGQGLVRDIATPQANTLANQLPDAGVLVRPGTTVVMLFIVQ